ncbi:MAG: pterin-4-alpha-carbinolamine dehydratase [Comamonadaceae bacterium]|nr:pterin-4-alpha-carbinolamine dehydratase [Comamonadaceae bacterium]
MNPIHQHRNALSATQIVTQLTQLNGDAAQGWRLIDGALEKTYSFPDFHQTMAFVNALAWVAHREDHHPDLAVGFGRCTVRFNTHDVDGISVSDFFCAAAVDALLKN